MINNRWGEMKKKHNSKTVQNTMSNKNKKMQIIYEDIQVEPAAVT